MSIFYEIPEQFDDLLKCAQFQKADFTFPNGKTIKAVNYVNGNIVEECNDMAEYFKKHGLKELEECIKETRNVIDEIKSNYKYVAVRVMPYLRIIDKDNMYIRMRIAYTN
ncbi:MAG: hypothetical protein ACFFDF_00420 [Candidatus Odinarchaeota archaeon]